LAHLESSAKKCTDKLLIAIIFAQYVDLQAGLDHLRRHSRLSYASKPGPQTKRNKNIVLIYSSPQPLHSWFLSRRTGSKNYLKGRNPGANLATNKHLF
jgi:hypothetical protein